MPGGNDGAHRQYGRRVMPAICGEQGPAGHGAIRREKTLSVNQQKSVREFADGS